MLVINFVKSRMRKSRTSGSVGGVPRKGHIYPTKDKKVFDPRRKFVIDKQKNVCYNLKLHQCRMCAPFFLCLAS